MPWESLGPSGFRPVSEGMEHFFVPVTLLRAALAELNASMEKHGDATILIVEDKPCDPVYLPKPVRGCYGYPTIEKLCRNSTLSDVDVCRVMRDIVQRETAVSGNGHSPQQQTPVTTGESRPETPEKAAEGGA